MVSPEFFQNNRERFAAALPNRTAALLFSGESKKMSSDTDYRFFADRNFYYLTGLENPGYVLLIEKDDDNVRTTLYAPARDSMKERWHGKRMDFADIAAVSGVSVADICDLEKCEEKEFELIKNENVTIYLDNSSVMEKPFELKNQIEMYDTHKDAPATYRLENGWQQRPYNDGHVFASAGAGLWTTANDQLKFYKMLMNLGVGDNGVRILKEETVKSILAVTTRPDNLGGYSLGLNAPKKDGENEWFGHGGAWGTNCMVNWHKKQLKLWVVQLNGAQPWNEAKDKAAEKFFSQTIDTSGIDAYTGRVK